MHLYLDAAPAVVSAPVPPEWPTQILCARSASFLAMAPAVVGFHGWAFLRGVMTAEAPRSAMALWHLRVSYAPSAVTLPIS
jgi:hypothetical protein